MKLSSDKFARAVYLSAANARGLFVDNFFDLIPGRVVEVEFAKNGAIQLAEFRKQIKVRTLVDAF